jgi:tubulin polyglutamylase TTLL6/13
LTVTREGYSGIKNGDRCVVQRYLHKPFLIDGLKFDLRIYVLVTGTDPLRLYVFEEGLARFATEPYVAPRTDNLEEVCMHLTNYAINKDSPNFVFNESTKGIILVEGRYEPRP